VNAKISEIVVAWQWNDGTRCVLCEAADEQLELRVTNGRRTLRREPVVDVLVALRRTAPVLEVELSEHTHIRAEQRATHEPREDKPARPASLI
jgi:hypothetical protein